jgi:ATP-binding cassette subfamily B protein
MIIVVMFAFIFYVLFFLRAQQKARIALNNSEDYEKAFVSDVFTNIDTIKYFGKENRTSSLFVEFASKTKSGFIKNWDFDRWTEAGQTFIIGAGIMLLLYFPLIKFLNGEISIGTIAFIYTVYLNIAEPLGMFIWGMRRFYQSLADFHSLTQYGDLKKDVVDKVNAPALKISKGKIEFKDVSFTYHKKEVINNFSLKVNPNEKVAIVGYSGSGKTTLIKLLYRLYDINAGSIFIDGKNIVDIKQESLRSELSIVPQECILFNDTIYNNVVFANPKASKNEVISALKAAQLYDFVIGLPEKENTFVGERGIKLSGGEKQRLSIARAILAKKKVLVLDEATSSLDSKTEMQIKNALNVLMKNKTTIIIAHRLSTIMEADKIIVLDKGKIVQGGKHNELINQKGIYKGLWNMQKGGYIE